MSKKRPGIIHYFDMYPSLKQLSNEQLGKLYRASMEYGISLSIPDFSDDPFLNFAWGIMQQRIDADDAAYREKTGSSLYSTYCREAKKKGLEPVSYSFWSELSSETQRKMYESVSNGIGCIDR